MKEKNYHLELKDIQDCAPAWFILSNGKIQSFTNTYGGGYIKYKDTAITSNRGSYEDGLFFYIRESENVWSSSLLTVDKTPEEYDFEFLLNSVKFHRVDRGIDITTEIIVPDFLDFEIRKLSIKNLSADKRNLQITSYIDPVLLDDIRKDMDHQAFYNLFIQARFDKELKGLIFNRRTFSPENQSPLMFYRVYSEVEKNISYETNRKNFIGRLDTLSNPDAVFKDFTNFEGDVLDPAASFRIETSSSPDEEEVLYFVTMYASSLDQLTEIARKFDRFEDINHLFKSTVKDLPHIMAEMGLSKTQVLQYQHIFSLMSSGNVLTAGIKNALPRSTGKVDSLWKHRISGDFPLLLILANNIEQNLLKKIISCKKYLNSMGYAFDLVFLAEDKNSIENIVIEMGLAESIDAKPGIYLLNLQDMEEKDLLYLKHFAKLILDKESVVEMF